MSGYISIEGKKVLIGEAYAGVKVAMERGSDTGEIRFRYGNVKLGSLEGPPNARLRPPAYDERWEKRACAKTEDQLPNKL